MQLQTTAIIRNRGQLTIPETMRSKVGWTLPGSVVTIAQTKQNEIVIKPHIMKQNKFDWDQLWKKINLVRSFKGKYSGSLSEFIEQDRQNH